jgi:hypothetical protein
MFVYLFVYALMERGKKISLNIAFMTIMMIVRLMDEWEREVGNFFNGKFHLMMMGDAVSAFCSRVSYET